MELRHLRAFVAIADHGHYGQAAVSLRVTQPAITHRIQALERELGVQLLTRNARETRLTPVGEMFIHHARALVQIEDRALADLKDHEAGIAGRLRIAYLTLWDIGIPAAIVAEFRRRFPAVKLEMTSGYSQANMDRLVNGDVDFAFVSVSIGERKGIAIRPLERQELVAVMHPANRLMEMPFVPIELLRGQPMIGLSAGVNDPLAAKTVSWLANNIGAPPSIAREEPPDQMAAALADGANSIALMTVHRATISRNEGLDYRRLTPRPLIEYGIAYLRDNASPVAANLMRVVGEVSPPLPGEVPAGFELLSTRQESGRQVPG